MSAYVIANLLPYIYLTPLGQYIVTLSPNTLSLKGSFILTQPPLTALSFQSLATRKSTPHPSVPQTVLTTTNHSAQCIQHVEEDMDDLFQVSLTFVYQNSKNKTR